MVNKLMQIIAPHYCYGCGKVGVLLCEDCKYDIVDDTYSGCVVCAHPSGAGICSSCKTTYERAWCVGEREGALRNLIDAYKFERVGDAAPVLASLLDHVVPSLPNNTFVVHVPTLPSHIRQRGYDHAENLAVSFAHIRSLSHDSVLTRMNNNHQRGQSKQVRMKQAESMFACSRELDPACIYMLIDDIVTSNASLSYAAAELRRAGAVIVWVAVVARQPLGK